MLRAGIREDLGIATKLAAAREHWKHKAYRAPTNAEKVHRITVDLRTGAKTVETVAYQESRSPAAGGSDLVKAAKPVVPAGNEGRAGERDTPKTPPPASVDPAVKFIGAIRPRGSGFHNPDTSERMQARIQDIVVLAASSFGVPLDDLVSPHRRQKLSRARFAAFWLMRQVLRISSSSIGRVFHRDHTTILAGLRRAAELRRRDPAFCGRCRVLARALRQRWAVAGQAALQASDAL